MSLNNLSLFKECFGDVVGEVQELSNAPLTQMNSRSLKYETKVPQLEYMCLMMENMVITKKLKGNVYAGFQKFSRAENVIDRFRAMTEYSNVYIFGEDDAPTDPTDGINYISLPPQSELMREWFLVIDSPVFKSMMVAYDMEGFGIQEIEEDRKFKGVKTSNPQTIQKANDLLAPHVNATPIG
ncbi:histidine kinase [Pontibacillus halophilus JSM 076056 = DSM 19796]|uniref:Histidine kinase n=1 Tax=Pontibacillus halophilus JSM 076056 = DSM 19796 TaxID=1385510 RepID=A0A0A5IDX3_9BACI|nr:DICT sensory domain-containing protein [Pontibacillus halophilus]KGX94007.1 histidine kinase [Pontibacillus halophilus JSM 076056 = DSM 19796]